VTLDIKTLNSQFLLVR